MDLINLSLEEIYPTHPHFQPPLILGNSFSNIWIEILIRLDLDMSKYKIHFQASWNRVVNSFFFNDRVNLCYMSLVS